MSDKNLKAIILTGGQSKRMGSNKATLQYYGVPHAQYLGDICNSLNIETFMSVNHLYCDEMAFGYPVLNDRFVAMGPLSGILTAFHFDNESSWLVLACDLPFVNDELIQVLIDNRNQDKVATCIKSFDAEFPEPLITIYEPSAYPLFLSNLSRNIQCPRKLVINEDVHIIEVDSNYTLNANTPDDKAFSIAQIAKDK